MRRPKGQPEKRPRGEASERTAGKRSPEEKPAREFRDRRPAQRKRPPKRLRRSFCLLQRSSSGSWLLPVGYHSDTRLDTPAADHCPGKQIAAPFGQMSRTDPTAARPAQISTPTDRHPHRSPTARAKKRKYPITDLLAVLPSLLSSPSCRPHRLAVSASCRYVTSASRYPLRL